MKNNLRNLVRNQIILLFESKLLKEADYNKILIDKVGLPKSSAEYLVNRLGKLSVWFINAVIKQDFDNKEDAIKYFNERPFWIRTNYDNAITKIVDWIRHPLIAGTVNLKELSLQQAIENSDKFHDELKEMGGEVDYVENNEKIVQYDNKFYWIKIPSNYSNEECNRMGHCGKTQKGDTLFSLRSNLPYGKGHTINDSHITVAYNSKDGLIYQSKGKKNSKPSNKYFPYFSDLILRLPKFNGFGREYQSSEDISFEDFTNEELLKIMQKFPEAFKSYKSQKILFNRGLIKNITAKAKIVLKLNPDEISSYVKTDRDLRNDIIKKILIDPYDIYEPYYDENTWKYVVDDINEKNTKTILNYIKDKFPEIDITSGNIEEILEENKDELDSIITAINQADGDARSADYQNYCYKQLKSSLEYWGHVEELNDTGAVIEVDIDNFFDNIDAEYVDEAMEKCDDDRECAFNELVNDGTIDVPRFYLDDRYDPYPNKNDFNEYLENTLDFNLS